ncbi:hypothetical protein [Edaphobacter flagellatus]|uniref:hypothetical protein n=1 Tax=Edaphobacter flagellatus TaxID=1933044 RepID=UPI0021B36243|nr:hypothetical protein [Edaphobacter flagellatus]
MRSKFLVVLAGIVTVLLFSPRAALAGNYCPLLFQDEMQSVHTFLMNCTATGESYFSCKQEQEAKDLATEAASDYYSCTHWVPQEGYPPPSLPSAGGGTAVSCSWADSGNGTYDLTCDLAKLHPQQQLPHTETQPHSLDCFFEKYFDRTHIRMNRKI